MAINATTRRGSSAGPRRSRSRPDPGRAGTSSAPTARPTALGPALTVLSRPVPGRHQPPRPTATDTPTWFTPRAGQRPRSPVVRVDQADLVCSDKFVANESIHSARKYGSRTIIALLQMRSAGQDPTRRSARLPRFVDQRRGRVLTWYETYSNQAVLDWCDRLDLGRHQLVAHGP